MNKLNIDFIAIHKLFCCLFLIIVVIRKYILQKKIQYIFCISGFHVRYSVDTIIVLPSASIYHSNKVEHDNSNETKISD